MKIYLAGPMRGYANFNFPAFDFAAERLRLDGHEVFSPAERDRTVHGHALENNPTGDENLATRTLGFSLREALGADTAWICEHADAIALLPGWEKSSGANAELALSKALGLTIITLGKDMVRG
jgi:Domain of unknown function (DUF4406)